MSIRVLGIDPGSINTGFGIIDIEGNNLKFIAADTIKLGSGEFNQRLLKIHLAILELIQKYQPQEFAIEEVFMSKNANTALKLGHARGAAILAAVISNLKVNEYAARLVKQTVAGKGSAEKDEVNNSVKKLLKIQEIIKNDAADALAIAITHFYFRNKDNGI